MDTELETWELWFPDAAATGLLFARTRVRPTDRLLVHAAPDALAVVVRDSSDAVLARADRLCREGEATPMTWLTRTGNQLNRKDGWPTDQDLGLTVLLAGGEAAVLFEWWHAPDKSEWRWQVELYNHR